MNANIQSTCIIAGEAEEPGFEGKTSRPQAVTLPNQASRRLAAGQPEQRWDHKIHHGNELPAD